MTGKNILILPSEIQSSARILSNGEVCWPMEFASAAINAIADSGQVILGLDIREYDEAGKSFFEYAWSDAGNILNADDAVEIGRSHALASLNRPAGERYLLAGSWVLISFADATEKSTVARPTQSLDESEAISVIRTVLNPLVGLPVRSLGHQVGMLMIGFGEVTTRTISRGPKKGEERDESQFHLHVSTGWSVRENRRALISDDSEGNYGSDTRPTHQSLTLLSATIGPGDRTLEEFEVDDLGNIDFKLSGGVEILVLRSWQLGEEWRLWDTGNNSRHFVIEIAGEGSKLLTLSGDFLT